MRALGGVTPMSIDTVFAIHSATKPLTAAACLRLVEEGRLDLDAPAKTYVPQIGQLQVLEGFDEDGGLKLRSPKRDVTTRMLLLHTAGFGYDFYSAAYRRLAKEHRQPNFASATSAALKVPLLFDPGDRWMYGMSSDWAGQVVEGASGQRLSAYMKEVLFEPLAMSSTGFVISPQMRPRLATMHQRKNGALIALEGYELPQPPEVDMGGHGLYSTADDYISFIRMWLNDGMGPDGPVLRPESVQLGSTVGLGPNQGIQPMVSINERMARNAELFPGLPQSWSPAGMVNEEPAPTGRHAGALSWAGLANVIYWIDRAAGVGGIWCTQVLPFMDEGARSGFLGFERAVYEAFRS